MADFSAEEPAWGTPPGQSTADPDEVFPSWGTPPSHLGQPDPPDRPNPRPGLLTADLIAVIEQRAFMGPRSYDLLARDGTVLGYLSEQTSAGNWLFGAAASSTFVLSDASGQVLARMHRPGSMGRFQFVVTHADQSEIGTVEQENAFFAPQFELRSADGVMRLAGGSFGSTEWELVDASNDSLVYGRVSQEFAGFSGLFGSAQRFAVRLSPALTGESRLLAVMATVCLDYVRDAKRRR